MTVKRTRRTIDQWIDAVLAAKTVVTTGIVRRALTQIPKRFELINVLDNFSKRGLMVMLTNKQLIVLTDRSIRIIANSTNP